MAKAKFYAELEVNGYIKFVGDVKKTAKGKDFISGVVGWHDTFEGKDTGWSSVPFLAFDEELVNEIALLQKDDEIHLKGKLQTKYDKDKKINNFTFIPFKIVEDGAPNRQPKPKQTAKQEPVETIDEEDDLPF